MTPVKTAKAAAIALSILLLSGCSVAKIHLPDGATYERAAFLHKLEVDEATLQKGGMSLSIKGGRSDSTKALDVAAEALQRVPKVP